MYKGINISSLLFANFVSTFDLNTIFRDQNVTYVENVDAISNYHGRIYGADMCNTCNIFPINHLKRSSETLAGDFTYFKGDKKSQIDFVYTDRVGIKHIEKFIIIDEDWHLSDHRPIIVEIKSAEHINTSMLLRRA